MCCTPLLFFSIWDDGYGISVPNEFQVTKADLSALLSGFQRDEHSRDGYDVYTVRAWDYPTLLATYQQAADTARAEHIPALIHVIDVTQPQGHSTSGSHERYKSSERLSWEEEFDGIRRMRDWIIRMEFTGPDELDEIEARAKSDVELHRAAEWEAFTGEIIDERAELMEMLSSLEGESRNAASVTSIRQSLGMVRQPLRKDVALAARQAVFATRGENGTARQTLAAWKTAIPSLPAVISTILT